MTNVPSRIRRPAALVLGAVLALGVVPQAEAMPAERPAPPDRIELPVGWQPEGITTDGKQLFVGSLVDGRILRADPRDGTVTVLPRSRRTKSPAVGVDHDSLRGVLWVAGGEAGEIRAHSAKDGRVLGRYLLPEDDGGRFVNDIVVTPDAVYATDSNNAELAVVPLDGRRVPRSADAEVLPLTGDFELVDDFNLNGIMRSGSWLLAVQSATGTLFRIDPDSGEATAVDLGGYSLTEGDGLEPGRGSLLYVVRNRRNLVVALDLSSDRTTGEVVNKIRSKDFDVPTTVARIGKSLFAVNARFGNKRPERAAYWITRLRAVS